MNRAALEQLSAQGESGTLEIRRSTAELRRAGETLCAFLNGEGGHVVIGVAADGKITRTVEVWGRGTNRVIEACRTHGIAPPEFSEQAGVVTVAFKAAVVTETVPEPSVSQVGPKSVPSASPSPSAGDCSRSESLAGIDGLHRAQEQDPLPGPSLGAPPRGRPA
jgi:predicted HTH transcriptional regulator